MTARRHPSWWRVAVISSSVALVAGWSPSSAVPAAATADPRLTIRSQVFGLDPGDQFEVTVGLPDGLDARQLGADAVVNLVSHAAMTSRQTFLEALVGTLGAVDDELQISLDPALTDTAISRPSAETLSLSVPTDVTPAAVPAEPAAGAPPGGETPPSGGEDRSLTFLATGVHAVQIDVFIDGVTVARTTTFVNVHDPDVSFGDLSVGLVMGTLAQPIVAEDGTVSVSADGHDELNRLADTLAAIDAVADARELPDDALPRAVFVEPSSLQAAMATDPDLASRLTPGLVRSDVIAAPRLPFEPSAAAAAGQEHRYTQLLSEGEDLLDRLLPRTHVGRIVHIVREPFTAAAADLQRKQVGARLMVMGFDLYDRSEGGNGMFTDTTQLVTIALPDDTVVPTAVIDPHIGPRLDDGADEPMLTAVEIVADLLVIAGSIHADGGVVPRHGMVLARSDAGVLDAEVASALIDLLSTTDGVRLVTPSQLGSSVDVLTRPGSGDVSITLPDQEVAQLDGRVQLIKDISEEVLAFASMLPDDDPQIDGWLRVLDAIASTAVDDAGATAMVDRLRADFDVYRRGVQGPEPFTFTLTSRSNTLTLSLRNVTDTDLEVRVGLSSPKLTFPDGDQAWLLPKQTETEINVRAEALSNGKSSVFLRVYTPNENSDIEVMPEVVLTARVTSLAGLGQLLTGAGLLLLLTWWARHWQQARRKRNAAAGAARHPSSNGRADDELTGDTTATSLPPS